ncbi:MAG: methyl-accepting chemotaxis protein [Gammaproteobacteria bacterium]|nr:methyl-accepting chemotaxis protein [Gammaproteobacteria bacterium]
MAVSNNDRTLFQRYKDLKLGTQIISVVSVCIIFGTIVLSSWAANEQKNTALEQTRDFSENMHQLTMAGLTAMMQARVIRARSLLMDQIRVSNNIEGLKLIRNKNASFPKSKKGSAKPDEATAEENKLAHTVMENREPYFSMIDEGEHTYLQVIRPIIASENYLGKNCLKCHKEVTEGDVLGVTMMNISLDHINKQINDYRIKLFAFSLFGVLCLISILYFLIKHSVSKPTDKILSVVTHAINKDLTHKIDVTSQDEIGMISSGLETFYSTLKGTLQDVVDHSNRVAESSKNLVYLSEELAGNTTSNHSNSSHGDTVVASIAKKTNDDLGKITESTKEISISFTSVNTALVELSESVTQANKRIIQAADITQTASNNAKASNQAVNNLNESSHKIEEVINVIQNIAQQTNLLALNAAIEAARAGDSGRGFAVVANEVKKLADETSDATEQIKGLIEHMQKDTGNTVETIKGIVVTIGEMNEISQAISSDIQQQRISVDNISSLSESTTVMARDIDKTVEQAVESVNQGIRQSSKVAATRIDSTSAELFEQSHSLQKLVSQFKLNS